MIQHCPPAPAGRLLVLSVLAVATTSCGDPAAGEWAGSVDTLATGQVVVTNPGTPLWAPDAGWSLTEELRIGRMDGEGPDLFGRIESLAVDGAGRIHVLDSQAQEVRVFDSDGAHVRTIGRKGGGPGEFARALQVEYGPDGKLYVVDPQNNRLSVFDSAGAYIEGHAMAGGFVIIPWPGGFDRHGRYHYPVPRPSDDGFRLGLARYDTGLQVMDTLTIPEDPVERDRFELRRGQSVMVASIPFAGGFRWKLSPDGTFWGLLTGEYRMFELSPEGDTLRTVTRAFERLPVTETDMAQAREDLEWFTSEGGEVDWSKIPDRKPGARTLAFDDQGHVWVWPVTTAAEEDRVLDVFDATGRYLGRVDAPVPIQSRPAPVIGDDVMYAVTESELEVPYVVRLRIAKPGSGERY